MRETPGAADAVGNDLAVRCRQGCAGGERALPCESLEQNGGKVVDVAGLEIETFLAFGSFADAVAAELDDLANGEDVGWFDVLVDEIAGMESLERRDETSGDLVGFFHGEGSVLENFGEVGVSVFEESVDERSAIDDGLPALFQGDKVGLFDLGDLTPAVEYLGLIKVSFDETDDGGRSSAVGGGEEGAATFWR